jgi:hypothetical protein
VNHLLESHSSQVMEPGFKPTCSLTQVFCFQPSSLVEVGISDPVSFTVTQHPCIMLSRVAEKAFMTVVGSEVTPSFSLRKEKSVWSWALGSTKDLASGLLRTSDQDAGRGGHRHL